MKHLKNIWVIVMIIAISVAGATPTPAKTTAIKVALVTPDGSTWTNTIREMAKALKKESGGTVKLKIYPGGIKGDELDVLRQMRANRLHASGFSGVGMGVILPQIRILEAPLLFKNYAEIDHVKTRLFDRFSAEFEKKGYVLLGFAEAGFVYFYSKKSLKGPAALKSVKMWAWKGDPVAEAFLKTFGIRTYPLHLADVNTGLETGMIDSFYSPPLAAVAFQWTTRVEHILDYPMVNSTGALLISKRMFYRLSQQNQALLRSLSLKYCTRLVDLTRKENKAAMTVLTGSGIQIDTPTEDQVALFAENARKTYAKNIPALYSRELFDQVSGILKAFRAGRE
ncbi:MAG: ABC transporter substrate-binding protein [Desulfobacterales bacterium]|nr:ABC transporter substrate-binding protein [Desulfobacterales bacterium]